MAEDFLTFLPLFPDEDESAILARWREWANEGLDPATDVEQWTDVREGAHWHIGVMPGVREFARFYDLAGTEVPAAGMPIWAWSDYLDDHAAVQQIDRKVATRAQGEVTFIGSAGTVIAEGTGVGVEPVEPDEDVPEYEATTGGTIPAAASPPTGLDAVGVVGGGTLGASSDFAYRVTALDAAGETLGSTEDVGAIPAGGPGHMNVTWNAVASATSYRLYRADSAGGTYGLLAEVGTTSYTDTGAVAPDTAIFPPAVNTTGGALTLPVMAIEAGVAGDVSAEAVTVIATPLAGVVVVNREAISDGTEAETDESLRERVLGAYAGKGAGNRRDYERWAREWEGVGRVTVIPLWDGPSTVKVIVTDPAGLPLPQIVVDALQADLDPVAGHGDGTAPISATVTVTTATIFNVDVAATIEFEDGYSLDGFGGTLALRDTLEDAIAYYIERVHAGSEIVVQQVVGRITNVVGVHDVADVTVEGATTNVAVSSDPAQAPLLVRPTGLAEGPV